MGATSAFGQRMFFVPVGGTDGGDDYTYEATGGETVVFDAYLEETGCAIRQHQVWFDCLATGGTVGSVDFVSDSIDTDRTDYVFYGLQTLQKVENQGNCPTGDPMSDGPRASQACTDDDKPTVTTAKYLSTWSFEVSTDAQGTFTLRAYCPVEDGCQFDRTNFVCEDNSVPTFDMDDLIIEVPLGSCCVGQDCTPDVTEYYCVNTLGGLFRPGVDCPPGGPACACYADADCEALTDDCSYGTCINPGDNGYCEFTAHDCSYLNTDCMEYYCVDGNGEGNCVGETIINEGGDCDDGELDPCTWDHCVNGECVHTNAADISCDEQNPCPVGDCDLETGFCVCAIEVCLDAEVDTRGAPEDCVPYGAPIVVKVNVGTGPGMVGVQGRVEWDPADLVFTGIMPGNDCDTESEFTGFIPDSTEVGDGWVFFAAETGIPVECEDDSDCASWQTCDMGSGLCTPVAQSSDGGVAAACLYFDTIECEHGLVCLCEEDEFGYTEGKHNPPDCNPHDFRIVNNQGLQMPWQPCAIGGMCEDIIPDTQIAIDCPDDINVGSDCHEVTAMVSWDCPTASDLCGTPGPITCECDPLLDSPACNPDWITDCGGEFPQGSWLFHCTVTDEECEDTAECYWTVTVTDETLFDVFVQLSPIMDPGPFTRCIEFQLWTACTPLIVGEPFCEEMLFGGDYHGPGKAELVTKVPKGQYFCMTARDPAHTLRASDFIECDEVTGMFSAEFKDDPFFGGNWLVGGNLDGTRDAGGGSPRAIDIIDYGIFVSQFLDDVGADVLCPVDCTASTWDPHADINGDGFVDDIDFSFISINFLEYDKDACCPERAPIESGMTSVSVRELNKMGLGHLSVADLNADGMVDLNDMAAFMSGDRPKAGRSIGHK
jgi:hypothetical protein